MLKAIKFVIYSAILLALLATAVFYGALTLSLPALSGSNSTDSIDQTTYLQRDDLGTAIIIAQNRSDASYALGFAHGQDRFFQMDLLRRNAAGELAALFGEAALPIDENRRFHQFRKRSEETFKRLPEADQRELEIYSNGVNDALAQLSLPPFEYLVTQTQPLPWKPEDSLLAIFSMYLDLQGRSLERDLLTDALYLQFGDDIAEFLLQPSPFQAALDDSIIKIKSKPVPELPSSLLETSQRVEIEKSIAVGSNNWAVEGSLTRNGKAMLSDDMHLGLAVPVIWYRTQLNIQSGDDLLQITGVSLPGAPAIVVGSNGHIAWGFTNGYMDTADWYRLNPKDKTRLETETIPLKEGEHKYLLEQSEFGPVRVINGQKYALSWVAHRDYAVNLNLMKLEQTTTVQQALDTSKTTGIPLQNMVLADSAGNIAWQATGALPDRREPFARPEPSNRYDKRWLQSAKHVPYVVNPKSGRIWTGNSRVVGAEKDKRFGNGGYALGARSAQIKQRLMEKDTFDIEDFYAIQLDNEAIFLQRWHGLLLGVLEQDTLLFQEDIKVLNDWHNCACEDSVGYTLVRKYRDALIDKLFAPLETKLEEQHLSLSLIERQIEPALWQLVSDRPESWVPSEVGDWNKFLVALYLEMRESLMIEMTGHADGSLQALKWGEVNQLKVQHPFSRQLPVLGNVLDMPSVQGFGDRFMPAVQGRTFGASQRLIVQPGDEINGVLTLPGGQSGHPLSPFYREGFESYINNAHTPLLPGPPVQQILFKPN
ncbi:penicillin acylase family protein [Grimontia sp. NTOU-MAR1]|uniref:penicillin acylase family protein n=1 Tax=Grimontia sp. NTOU-MAR1 TaxID=3111011 RepID=UPI002DB5DA3E|nr:penicillin acylase family protein [Grimontia sp. NTOU-MAR1]WRV98017.1 penicillin acylase family protein [Grimontia sp. NTOU-MAR1]